MVVAKDEFGRVCRGTGMCWVDSELKREDKVSSQKAVPQVPSLSSQTFLLSVTRRRDLAHLPRRSTEVPQSSSDWGDFTISKVARDR